MRTFLTALLMLCGVLTASAQVISMRQLTNYAVAISNGRAWNLRAENFLTVSNDIFPIMDFTAGRTNGVGAISFLFGDNSGASLFSWQWRFSTNFFVIKDTNSATDIPFGIQRFSGNMFLGRSGSTTTNKGDLRVQGIAYDQNNRQYITTLEASNNVRVAAGAGILVTPSGSANVMTYTVTSTGGSGSTNAISALTTNGGIVGIGLTALAVNNGYGINVAGVSNNGAATLVWNADFTDVTNYVNAQASALSTTIYTVGANTTGLVWTVGANTTGLVYTVGANTTGLVWTVGANLTNLVAAKQDSFANLSALGNSGITFPTTGIISNVNQIVWNLLQTAVPTNSSLSNITVTAGARYKVYITATNNLTFTNLVGFNDGVATDVTYIIEPQLVPRGIAYPTFSAPSFGVYANTNDNAPMWTTLTNGNKYALTISGFGTNTFWSISRWK